MITAPTAAWSSTQRVATLAIETRCLRATPSSASSSRWRQRPAARGVDEAPILQLAPVRDRGGLGRAQPALRQKAAAERAEGQQLHAKLGADRAHPPRRPAVEQREAHLVGRDLDAVPDQEAQMRGVEIGDAERADQPVRAQARELRHRVEIGGVVVAPPVELHHVDPLAPEALERALDPGAHDRGRHRPRRRAPLGHDQRRRAALGGEDARRAPRHELGGAVVVRHVERIEPVARIGRQRLGRRIEVGRARALLIRHLPQAGDDPADGEAGREGSFDGSVTASPPGQARAARRGPGTPAILGPRRRARQSPPARPRPSRSAPA